MFDGKVGEEIAFVPLWHLADAAGFGLGTAYLFAVWPLAKAEEVRAADLFRRLVAIPEGRPKPAYFFSMLAATGGLALLALIATRDIKITSSGAST